MLSSHLLGEIEQICDRVGIIRDGRLVAEGTVEELRGAAGLTIRVEAIDRAVRVLERVYDPSRVQVSDGSILLRAAPSEAPNVSRQLVEAGVDLFELRPRQQTLEEVFMNLTDAA